MWFLFSARMNSKFFWIHEISFNILFKCYLTSVTVCLSASALALENLANLHFSAVKVYRSYIWSFDISVSFDCVRKWCLGGLFSVYSCILCRRSIHLILLSSIRSLTGEVFRSPAVFRKLSSLIVLPHIVKTIFPPADVR